MIARVWSDRARVLATLGSFAEAETLNVRSLEILRASFGEDHAHVHKVEQQLADVRAARAKR